MEQKKIAMTTAALTRTAAVVCFTTLMLPVSASAAQLLVENRGSYAIDQVEFKRIEYVGGCPGIAIEPNTAKARFTSSSAPPAPGQRVRIRNVTKGMDNGPYPYADRQYEQGRYSEGFNLKLGYRHRSQTFSVLEGKNQFEYEIYDLQRVIERGSFTALVAIKEAGTFPRDRVCTHRWEPFGYYYSKPFRYYYDRRGLRHRRYFSLRRYFPVRVCQCP